MFLKHHKPFLISNGILTKIQTCSRRHLLSIVIVVILIFQMFWLAPYWGYQ